jgi:hypothetical protein
MSTGSLHVFLDWMTPTSKSGLETIVKSKDDGPDGFWWIPRSLKALRGQVTSKYCGIFNPCIGIVGISRYFDLEEWTEWHTEAGDPKQINHKG